jgi:hypothetical protein
VAGLFFFVAPALCAEPSFLGQSGLVNMPDARIPADGTLRFGAGYFDPYTTYWSSLALFSHLELGARYTSIENTRAFGPELNFGTYKDKAFDAKLLVFDESHYFPALSFGTRDFLGTRIIDSDYLVVSKRFGRLDFNLGYGRNRLDGLFGGVRYRPVWPAGLGFAYEYDATEYVNDFLGETSGAVDRRGGHTIAVRYKFGWLGAQLAVQEGGDVGINAYLSIPLMQKEFIPKLDEPSPFVTRRARPTIAEWRDDTRYRNGLVRALEAQSFVNVQILRVGSELDIGFSHRRISLVGRSVGRAVRTAWLLGPADIRSIRITYFTLTDLALVTYHFYDLPLLERFFDGQITYGDLLDGMSVSYADPATATALSGESQTGSHSHETIGDEVGRGGEAGRFEWVPNEAGHALSLRHEDRALSQTRIVPLNIGLFFNDPNGALRYETYALGQYMRHFGRGLFFESGLRVRLLEDVSRVSDQSNSTLPHVRSDVADYKRDGTVKLNNLLLNQFLHLRPRVYARLSLGYYEEMYAGVGGQVLYFPKQGNWALDFALDHLRQRDTGGDFSLRDYQTTTAIGSAHYRLRRYGVTFTLRGGRFLARDSGARFEIKRRFRSGVRIGVWYTVTDGDDTTFPGSPGAPYHDKGVFVSIPLGSMLTRDTQAMARFSIAPWTRDVGQQVQSPGDLYTIVEDPLMFDWAGYHLLSDFHR